MDLILEFTKHEFDGFLQDIIPRNHIFNSHVTKYFIFYCVCVFFMSLSSIVCTLLSSCKWDTIVISYSDTYY